jgi:signal transduction histidine kinase
VRLCVFAVAPGDDTSSKRARASRGWTALLSAWGRVPAPDPDDPLLNYLRENPEILQREALAHGEAETVRAEAERLFLRYAASVLLPLADRASDGSLGGLIAVGPRADGYPFSDLEIELLQRVKTATTAALVATRLYDRLHRLHEELEAKVAARTAELQRALTALRGAQSQLVQTEKMSSLGLLVSGVSHELVAAVETAYQLVPELRALVAAYRSRLLELEHLADPAQERPLRFDFIEQDLEPLLQAIEEGARRARSVTRDLSSFARADSDRHQEADLHACLESTLSLLRHDLRDRISITRRYDDRMPLIPCFPSRLNQVFLNLLINAQQAIDGAGTIEIETELERELERVHVRVRDTGRGIPAAIIPRIFEPFFTTKRQDSKAPEAVRSGGSGLGLAISYGIIERHGGRITVQSQEGQGTEFHVELPTRPSMPMPRASWKPDSPGE